MTVEQQTTGLDRIVLFSDAVFAIAITLLVLDIDLPSRSEPDLTDALLDRWPQYTSFALSFLVIGIFWVAHHRVFRYVARFDSRLIWLNLLLLLSVAFLPYPTAVLGDHDGNRTAVVFYASAIALTGLASASVWQYATRARLLSEAADERLVRYFTLRSLAAPTAFLFSIPIAFGDVRAAEAFWFVPFVLIALIARLHPRR